MKFNIVKKAIAASITLTMLMTGCGSTDKTDGSPQSEPTTADTVQADSVQADPVQADTNNIPQEYDVMYSSIRQVLVNDLMQMDSDNLLNTFGIDAADLESYIYFRSEDVMKADTLIVLKVSDASAVEDIKNKLKTVNDSKAQEYQSYAPEQYDILQRSIISDRNNYVYYVVAQNAAEISKIIEKNI